MWFGVFISCASFAVSFKIIKIKRDAAWLLLNRTEADRDTAWGRFTWTQHRWAHTLTWHLRSPTWGRVRVTWSLLTVTLIPGLPQTRLKTVSQSPAPQLQTNKQMKQKPLHHLHSSRIRPSDVWGLCASVTDQLRRTLSMFTRPSVQRYTK